MKKGILTRVLFISSLLLCFDAHSKVEKKSIKGLDFEAVRLVVRAHIQEVKQCYTDLIIEGMAANGKIIATWDIDDKGSVQNMAIKENTSKDQALEGCVTEKVVNWIFPPAEEGKTFPVSYPFQFN